VNNLELYEVTVVKDEPIKKQIIYLVASNNMWAARDAVAEEIAPKKNQRVLLTRKCGKRFRMVKK
jgi:hypothetical protein